jgi:hypothetical protein
MTAGGDVPLLQLASDEVDGVGSFDCEEGPRSMCRKVLVFSLATARFISSKNIVVCDGALPDLGMEDIHLSYPALPW